MKQAAAHIAKKFSRAAGTYAEAAVLHHEVGQRLLERLSFMTMEPQSIVDLGCNTGHFTRQLAKQYRGASVLAIDIAEGMLRQARRQSRWWHRPRYLAADAASLPLQDNSVDMIYSALVLQWCPDLKRVFSEVQRVLRPGGIFAFATYGPDTLLELRRSWVSVDSYQHTLAFTDMHDIGDQLLAAGMADPVLDVEYFSLHYPSVAALTREIKAMGANYVGENAYPGLMGKKHWQAFVTAYEQQFMQQDSIPASFEIVYGHAWGKAPMQRQVGDEVFVPIGNLGA